MFSLSVTDTHSKGTALCLKSRVPGRQRRACCQSAVGGQRTGSLGLANGREGPFWLQSGITSLSHPLKRNCSEANVLCSGRNYQSRERSVSVSFLQIRRQAVSIGSDSMLRGHKIHKATSL